MAFEAVCFLFSILKLKIQVGRILTSIVLFAALLLLSSLHLSHAVSNNKQATSKSWQDKNGAALKIPFLARPPVIDGNIDEWKEYAFHDGMWDIYRVQQADWYQPERNRLTDHGNEPAPWMDLQARYYTAWDSTYLYMGAIVYDNVNDVTDPEHKPERWYYKDCVCWFIEAPQDTIAESFGQGDNAFCFIADKQKPPYGAWWRHGDATKKNIEEPIPAEAVDYQVKMIHGINGSGSFVLEARVNMAMTFGKSDPDWKKPAIGDQYSMEIVHTDPDGGDYGAHLILYGTGDNDATWQKATLAGPVKPLKRQSK